MNTFCNTSKTLFVLLVLLFIHQYSFAQCNCLSNNNNLLVNGDFQNPNTVIGAPNFIGFQSDYSATATIGNYGIFRWTNNANALLSIWCATTPPNYYLLFDATTGLDAAVAPFDAVRYSNIPVVVGTAYRFSFMSNNQYAPGGFATLKVIINGVVIDSFLENNTCNWITHTYCWVADTNTVTISVNAGTGTYFGRDFALDNFNFSTGSIVTTNIAANICPGTTFNFAGQTLTNPGIYQDTISLGNGCDSILILTLSLSNPIQTSLTDSICVGGSYMFGNNLLSTPGIYIDTFTAINNCDSIVTLALHPKALTQQHITDYICAGTTYTFGGQQLTTPGIYSDTFKSTNSCDSIVTLDLQQAPALVTSTSIAICLGENYNFGGVSLNSTGIYVDTFAAINGCDSVVQLNLKIIPLDTTFLYVTSCKDTSFLFGNQQITLPGIYLQTFKSNDCDSVVILNNTIYGNPTAAFLYNPNPFQTNIPTQFINQSINAISYLWNFGDGSYSSEENPIHNFPFSNVFTVCLTAKDNQGCEDKICKMVEASVIYVVDVPLAFSPNGDGENEKLYVRGTGVQEIYFKVYNRWGAVVFETNNISLGWDGKYKGKEQEIDTYAWTLEGHFLDGTIFKKIGNVSLIR